MSGRSDRPETNGLLGLGAIALLSLRRRRAR
jgi:MYXO-CTERM domain-containing protein